MVSSILNFYNFSKRSIWAKTGTLTGTTPPSLSEPGSYGNVGVLQTPLRSKTEALPSDKG